MQATQLFLKRRCKELKDDPTKWQQSKLVKKYQKFQSENSVDLLKRPLDAKPSIDSNKLYPTTKFFQDAKTECFEMQADGESYEMFESMRIYIERFGRPNNYLKKMDELNKQRE